MSCNSNVGSTSAFAAPAELMFDGVRIIFSLKFRPVRASSLCQVNTLAVAKTDKIKNSSALAICRTRENPRRNISRSFMIRSRISTRGKPSEPIAIALASDCRS